MLRDGALILADVRGPFLSIMCEPRSRHGRYRVAWLIQQYGGDAS